MATLNQSDQQVWKKVLAAKNQSMTQAQIQQSIPGMTHRELTMSLTQLIDLQLLKVETKDGSTVYHGIKPKDAKKSKASLTSEQKMVLSLVKAAHNRGVSQKALRGQIGAETIPTTLLRKTLEALEKGDFIKSFRSIHQPTIALYISPHVKPAVELTGGVWYDGQKEYDADFVNGITTFLYEKVKSATFPANDMRNPAHVKLVSKAIYPITRTKKLPTPYTLLQALRKSNLTQVKMKIPNIMECMRALELDGLVEAIKPVGGVDVPDIMGESDDEGPSKKRKGAESDTDEDELERRKEMAKEIAKDKKKKEKVKERKRLKAERAEKQAKEKEKKAKRREKEKEKERRRKAKKRKHKSIASSSESENGDDSDVLVAIDEEPKRKEKKRRRIQSDEESDDDRRSRRSSKKHRRRRSDSESDSGSDSEDERRRKKDKSKRRRSKYTESESESETESEPESDSDVSVSSVDSDELDLHDIALKPKSTAAAVDTSDLQTVAFARTDLGELTDFHVAYRATNLVNLPLGQTQISCGKCPQFNFCQEGGPVDPDSCAYLDDWLADVVGGWDPEARRRYQEEAAPPPEGRDLNGDLEEYDEDEDEPMSDA